VPLSFTLLNNDLPLTPFLFSQPRLPAHSIAVPIHCIRGSAMGVVTQSVSRRAENVSPVARIPYHHHGWPSFIMSLDVSPMGRQSRNGGNMTRIRKRLLQLSTLLAMGAVYLGTPKPAMAALQCPTNEQVSDCQEADSGMCDGCGASFNCAYYNGDPSMPGFGGVDPYDAQQIQSGGPGWYAFCAWAC
jgi:hypothetical protein